MKVAVVGATGMVGNIMIRLLEERNFPIDELLVVASEKSVGQILKFKSNEYKVIGLSDAVKKKPDLALFSAGKDASLEWAPKFAAVNTTIIDNSSAWRMDNSKKLIVPELNANLLKEEDKIIANPNCSTIQMVVALAPLHKKYRIKRLVISTYQSITGTGVKAVQQFENERKGIKGEKIYPYDIDKNCLPHCDDFTENGYTKEEMKLVNETRKIFQSPNMKITATSVRVPVVGGHSESVNVEFENNYELSEVKKILQNSAGVVVQDDVKNNIYPMPKYSENTDAVFVGRLRRDESIANALNIWIVADNIRKGAATNAIQIGEYLIKNRILK